MVRVASCVMGAGLPAGLATRKASVTRDPFEFSAPLNVGISRVDDGTDSETCFTGNDLSNTRIGFNGFDDCLDGRTLEVLTVRAIAPPETMRHSCAMGSNLSVTAGKILRRAVLPGALSILAGCGSDDRTAAPTPDIPPAEIDASTPRFASGPIGNACMQQRRPAASRERCGCVQAAANLTMSQSVQQRSVRFFNEPVLLEAMKLSDSPENERYWAIWASFAETAERLCKDT